MSPPEGSFLSEVRSSVGRDRTVKQPKEPAMASQLNPYLTFDGNAREAMEFYQSVFGGELKINTFGEFGNPDPAVADLVMHANLLSPKGYHLMASDAAPGMTLNQGNNVTVSLSGDPGEGLEEVWDSLADGGEV